MLCSCGESSPHVIISRKTVDGIVVNLWDNGAITGILGIGIPKVPLSRPKTPEAVARARALGMLLIGDVELYDSSELPGLYAAAKRAAAKDGLPGTMRRIFAEQNTDTRLVLHLDWRPVKTDNRGRVTERYARLPALRWPGLIVWDFCGAEGSSGGRYEVFHRVHSQGKEETIQTTGLRFKSLRELFDHLDTYPAIGSR